MTAPATAHTSTDAADIERFLMGGGGAPDAFKLIQRDVPLPPGTTVSGVITSWKMEQQRDYDDDTKLLYWKNGDPRMMLVVTVQTDLREPDRYEDDEGERRFFVKGEMQKALRAALEAAGKRTIERGGRLTIQLLGKGTPKDAKSKAPNLFSAHYAPPEVAQAEQFLAQGEPAPPAAGQVAAQVLAQPAAPMQVPGQAVAQALDPQYQAQQLLAAQLGAAPLAQPQAVQTPAPPVVPAAAPAPAQVAPAAAPPGLPPEVAAALAALTPEQRADALAAMGVQQ